MFVNLRSLLRALSCALFLFSIVAQAGSDPDSFGRTVRYLDMGLSPMIYTRVGNLACPAGALCHTITNVQASTSFTDANVVTIDLPAASTNSLVCFTVTPLVAYTLLNSSAAAATGRMTWRADVVVKSDVLDNPALINPVTGKPFNGAISIQGLTSHSVNKTLAAGAMDNEVTQYSRECQYGIVSLAGLQSAYGLSPATAQAVLSSAMSFRFSVTTTSTFATAITSRVGVRLFGD
jgi:hypothetical protein